MNRADVRRDRWLRHAARLAVLTAVAGTATNCIEPLPPFVQGSLEVAVLTAGGDVDLDGYVISLDGTPLSDIGLNETLLFESMSVGSHSVELTDLAANCVVEGDNPKQVAIPDGETLEVSFDVECAATGIWAVITSSGDAPAVYVLTVEGAAALSVQSTSSARVSRLSPGSHTVELTGLGANCHVDGANPVVVALTAGETIILSFVVSCGYSTGVIAVTTATSGVSLPTVGYELLKNGAFLTSVGINGTRLVGGLTAGSYSMELSGMPSNCTVVGANPVTANVTTGGVARDTASVAFAVSCAATGSIAVRTATSGLDGPRRAYGLVVDGSTFDSVAVGGSKVLDGFLAGDHTVELTGVPPNCAVSGANPITVAVATSGQTGDTTQVAFDVTCSPLWGLALTRDISSGAGRATAIHVAPSNGADATFFAWGSEPAWSPDGTKIVFAECWWDEYYYYYYGDWVCVRRGLSWSETDGTADVALTADASDADPSWHPDGSRIAFARRGGLYSIAPDGSGLTAVPLPLGVRASEPAWSPDGSALAFTCELGVSNLDICMVRPDGSGFVQLTNAPHREAGPAWKPDGSLIAYTDTRPGSASQIAFIAPNGTGQGVLATPLDALRPAWRADGTALGFVGVECNIYSGCVTLGLFRVNADGSGLTQMTSRPDDGPAWRPE